MPSDKVEKTTQIHGSQGPLGVLVGRSWSFRGVSRGGLEAILERLGGTGGGLGAPGGALGTSWGTLWALLGPLEPERLIRQKR